MGFERALRRGQKKEENMWDVVEGIAAERGGARGWKGKIKAHRITKTKGIPFVKPSEERARGKSKSLCSQGWAVEELEDEQCIHAKYSAE